MFMRDKANHLINFFKMTTKKLNMKMCLDLECLIIAFLDLQL